MERHRDGYRRASEIPPFARNQLASVMPIEYNFTLRQAAEAVADFVAIEDDLQFIMSQLARIPSVEQGCPGKSAVCEVELVVVSIGIGRMWRGLIDLSQWSAFEQSGSHQVGKAQSEQRRAAVARGDAQQQIGDHRGVEPQANGVFGTAEEGAPPAVRLDTTAGGLLPAAAAPERPSMSDVAPPLRNRWFPDSPLEGSCVDALRGSRAFLAWDCHAGCRFVSGLFARAMAAGLDGLSASRGSHLDFALDAHSLAAGLPR